MLDRWAAPGMNVPDDPDSPRGSIHALTIDPEKLAAARERDLRGPDQRNHDALAAFLDAGLATATTTASLAGHLVITISDAELATHAGVGLTGTGTLVPISDLIELAAGTTPHLEVFRHHTHEILYLGRGKRLANKAQRLALFGRDRGCTHPACNAPFSRTQAHHNTDWAKGGRTDIDELGAVCARHNRAVGDQKGQWETAIERRGRDAGRMLWRVNRPGKPWKLNPTHHLVPHADNDAHAPPNDDPDTYSIIEKKLHARLGHTA
ncbi:MAG: DUF222 domain-containing protein [Gordonia sp. (in: high G+C Gram-positive bacteria)]|uniref:HNH endonuclease signature motif containing protein n=1 Tax=Gordonia sp. (in: high G+C Gram-positive bacteria) TaxID=84139 RepID=UPI0039E2E5D1